MGMDCKCEDSLPPRHVGKVPELAAPYGRCSCGGEWRTDGQHSNEFCAVCFKSRPKDEGHDPYNTVVSRAKAGDTIEFTVPDTIEVVTLCEEQE